MATAQNEEVVAHLLTTAGPERVALARIKGLEAAPAQPALDFAWEGEGEAAGPALAAAMRDAGAVLRFDPADGHTSGLFIAKLVKLK